MAINWEYLLVTLLAVVFTAGSFMGITRTSFKSVENTLKSLDKQIQELRDDNKAISEIGTSVAVLVSRVDGLEKCQDHLQNDMNIFKKKTVKKVEE